MVPTLVMTPLGYITSTWVASQEDRSSQKWMLLTLCVTWVEGKTEYGECLGFLFFLIELWAHENSFQGRCPQWPKGLIAPNIATLGTKLPIHGALNSNHSSLLCELWIYIMFCMYKTCQNGSSMDSSPLAVSSGIGSPFFQNLALYQYCSLTGHGKKHLPLLDLCIAS